jgi:outer membrane protein assembly factor BamA
MRVSGLYPRNHGAPLLKVVLLCFALCPAVFAQLAPTADTPTASTTNAPSKFRSAEDGWFDVSGFLDEEYGFLPVVIPITEPAVGYGAAGGLSFISKPIGQSQVGYGRPNITVVGGLGTENGTWGAVAGDLRHWFDDRLQTLAGVVYASVNLDFYGIGQDNTLANHPLRYNLEPKGGVLQTKYRLGGSQFWVGLNYAFAATQVTFDAPQGTPGLPAFRHDSNVGGLTPSFTYDSRDNIFTPIRGTYIEASAGLFSQALGSDDDFQRLRLTAMQFIPLHRRLTLGFRGDVAPSFGDVPFYLRPYISLRGVPAMRYQGDSVAQIETELRWQFWKRFSLVGFVGTGAAWNNFEHFNSTDSVVTGGTGFRYELARKYGIHMGLDVAFGPDNTAIYVQVGSAWAKP